MDQHKGKRIPLSGLPAGVRAVVQEHGETGLTLMLMEMGCIPGEPVWVELVAPLGDPLSVRIAGYHLGIRKRDADHIWVTIP